MVGPRRWEAETVAREARDLGVNAIPIFTDAGKGRGGAHRAPPCRPGSTRYTDRPHSHRNRSGNGRAARIGRISLAGAMRSRDDPSVALSGASTGYGITTRKDGPLERGELGFDD